jgi:hypothetical protein
VYQHERKWLYQKKEWKLKIKRDLSEDCIEFQAYVNYSGKDIQKGAVIHWLCFMSNDSHVRYATISLGCEVHLHDMSVQTSLVPFCILHRK